MTDQVVFAGICKRYGTFSAVRDLNLGIKEGEFLTLLGPSGSGKTTTLRMLAGLEAATSGDILLAGRRVTDEVPEKRNIGLVFQNYALFPHMTVGQNVAFPLQMRRRKRPDIAREVDRVLEMTQLGPYKDRYPRQLSGGQQQRVALARAFVFDPSVLLMDEPLGALDRNLRDHMRLELKSLQERIGATVMYVTHDQDEALALSDRIGVMHQGVLQQTAPPGEIYERPVNSFVAKFLGQSVCLPAKRLERGKRSVLSVEGLDGRILVDAENDTCPDATGDFMIRPERFTLAAERPDTADVNAIRCKVETAVYLGAQVEVHLRAGAGAQVQVAVPAANAGDLAAGSGHWLTFRPSDGLYLRGV
ncbi:spermidine/putrescine ABC transporter ATP-binding protein [Spongiactinospora rosea]|uniref:Spermidine/putrescine ABC transporter ATP-binding protein n=1 Tax=Spongiactinospora rosea TaxID=2248750 RepID=A0A366LQJ3_9ACTN|nr:ABC transporter ATP-binding protein [Spongiactinospora rosea]RBQ16166.1 spermidine/putrescine ABC transporter ATP-binding protein [Spongiactinospora rosea]